MSKARIGASVGPVAAEVDVDAKGCWNYNFFQGKRSESDRLVLDEVYKCSWYWRGTRSTTVSYCCDETNPNHVISCIQAVDHWKDGTGAKVELTSGGVGETFVNLNIVSQWLRGFTTAVKIWTSENKTN